MGHIPEEVGHIPEQVGHIPEQVGHIPEQVGHSPEGEGHLADSREGVRRIPEEVVRCQDQGCTWEPSPAAVAGFQT